MNPDAKLYPNWSDYTLDQQGENRANNGMIALREWFESLTAQEKQTVKANLQKWKETSKNRIPGLKYD